MHSITSILYLLLLVSTSNILVSAYPVAKPTTADVTELDHNQPKDALPQFQIEHSVSDPGIDGQPAIKDSSVAGMTDIDHVNGKKQKRSPSPAAPAPPPPPPPPSGGALTPASVHASEPKQNPNGPAPNQEKSSFWKSVWQNTKQIWNTTTKKVKKVNKTPFNELSRNEKLLKGGIEALRFFKPVRGAQLPEGKERDNASNS